MPSVAQEQPIYPSSKKRRREDGDVHLPFTGHYHHPEGLFAIVDNNERLIFQHGAPDRFATGHPAMMHQSLGRKLMPLPNAKRARLIERENGEDAENPHRQHRSRPCSPSTTRSLKSPSAHLHSSTDTRPAAARTDSATLLSACHICRRKPTRRSDLDSYADCEACGQRTCYVCIRQCPRWMPEDLDETLKDAPAEEDNLSRSFHMEDADGPAGLGKADGAARRKEMGGWSGRGHHQMVCSGCCVERGKEGDVVCLSCLSYMEA